MSNVDSLMALSPLDGRYAEDTAPLRDYFSEYAFLKYRIIVELRYLEWLSKIRIVRRLTREESAIGERFSLSDALRVKEIELETRHDVKAVEYFLKEKIGKTDILPFLHFGLTSEDVNNLAYGMMLTGAHKKILLPQLSVLLHILETLTATHKRDVMLARTHGQPAVPTTFGKETAVFASRLGQVSRALRSFRFEGKVNGAVGNYNALAFAYPRVNWLKFSRGFIRSFGLSENLVTTQILPGDNLAEYCGLLVRANGILLGLCQDMWSYISRGLVSQRRIKGQVGSSTMPQKINPIRFENAEGNIKAANNYFMLFISALTKSRLQRDLSDSTIKRSLGVALGHTLLAWKSLTKGLADISFDRDAAGAELLDHWEILAEAVQIYARVHGDPEGYEKVKTLFMGKRVDEKTFRELTKIWPGLKKLTPFTYAGLAEKIAESAL